MLWLKTLFSRPALIVVALLGWSLAVAMVSRGCSPPPKPEVKGGMIVESTRTEPAPDVRDVPEVRAPPPPQIIVLNPSDIDRGRIAGEIKRQDIAREYTEESIETARRLGVISQADADAALAAYRAEQDRLARENRDLKDRLIQFERELVARRKIPASPWGGIATATTSRITGKTDIDYQRFARPRVNWLWDAGVGARFQWQDKTIDGLASEAAADGFEARAYVFVDPVEIGRRYPTRIRFDGGYEVDEIGDLQLRGWYAGAQADVHFNLDRRVNQRSTTEGEE